MKKLFLIISLLIASLSFGQINFQPAPHNQFFSITGIPLTGGRLFTYVAGTTTPQATFTDQSGSNQNSNPIILNSAGFISTAFGTADLWVTCGASYKYIMYDRNGVLQWSQDNVTLPCGGSGLTPHNLLSITHPDTVPYSPPAPGDIIMGNLSNLWSHLSRGTTGQVLAVASTT